MATSITELTYDLSHGLVGAYRWACLTLVGAVVPWSTALAITTRSSG